MSTIAALIYCPRRLLDIELRLFVPYRFYRRVKNFFFQRSVDAEFFAYFLRLANAFAFSPIFSNAANIFLTYGGLFSRY